MGSSVREKIVGGDGKVHIVSYQDAQDVVDGVAMASDILTRRPSGAGQSYLGSVPLLVAEIWANECGAAIGTREYIEYAKKKLTSGEYSKLHAKLNRG